MAVGMLLSGEGVTRDAYVTLTEAMFGTYPMKEDQAPNGLLIHTAGESDQGFYIYDVWESPEHFQRFADASLAPALAALPGDNPQPQPVFFPIEALVKGPSL